MTKTKKMNWKKNDWCFCEFELSQITDMKEGRITGVTTGIISHGGYELNDRCFPITMHVKLCSDHISGLHDKLHKEGSINLNHPDIAREWVRIWVSGCETDTKENREQLYKEGSDFYKSIMESVRNIREITTNGINVFRT